MSTDKHTGSSNHFNEVTETFHFIGMTSALRRRRDRDRPASPASSTSRRRPDRPGHRHEHRTAHHRRRSGGHRRGRLPARLVTPVEELRAAIPALRKRDPRPARRTVISPPRAAGDPMNPTAAR